MTLKPYNADMLDQFSLRLLDLAAMMRKMGNRSRECQTVDFTIHDKKAREWCDNLERWARKAQAELELEIIEARARRRAVSVAE
jgi:hypothetical protein